MASWRDSTSPQAQDDLDGLLNVVLPFADRRAVAFAADVFLTEGSDAVRIELEHRDAKALVLLVPYIRSRFKKTVVLGQMSGGGGVRRIWTD